MVLVLEVVAAFLLLAMGGLFGNIIGMERMLRRWRESRSEVGTVFFVRCPVCGHEVKCEKALIRDRLESDKPWVDCASCHASLIAPYMNHDVVREARAAYQHLVIANKAMREILQEPHHPVKQEEEEELKKSLTPPAPSAVSGALMVYSNSPKQQNR